MEKRLLNVMAWITPGPWTNDKVIVSGPDGMIAEFGFGLRDDTEMQANSGACAAIPEMLAALECARRMVGTRTGIDPRFEVEREQTLAVIDRAIAKLPDLPLIAARSGE